MTTIAGFALTVARRDRDSAIVAVEAAGGAHVGAALGRVAGIAALQERCTALVGRPLLDSAARWRDGGAAFGIIECALADLAARVAGVPLSLWLGGTAHGALPRAVVVEDRDDATHIAATGATMAVLRTQDWRAAASRVRALTRASLDVALDLGGTLAASDIAGFDDAARRLGIDLAIDPCGDPAARLRTAVALRALPGGLAEAAAALEQDRAQAIIADPARWGPEGIARLAALCRVFQASLLVAGGAHAIAAAFADHIAVATPAATRIVRDAEEVDVATCATPGLGIGLALDRAAIASAERIAIGAGP